MTEQKPTHHTEQDPTEHNNISVGKLNWLRAAVLGANDGIVSTSSIILGVVGATNDRNIIFTAGLAGLVAGALSMAVGEYVSVSSQKDSEKAYIDKEKISLSDNPDEELVELTKIYEHKGLSPATAKLVAAELTNNDPIEAHLDAEFNLDEDDLNSPAQAGLASFIAFSVGGVIPLIAVLVSPAELRFPVTFIAVIVTLAITGYFSAHVGEAPKIKAMLRVIIGGALAMIITFAVGSLFGTMM